MKKENKTKSRLTKKLHKASLIELNDSIKNLRELMHKISSFEIKENITA